MACDLPIIASRWRAIAATVPPEALLVEPGDTAALTAALRQLRADPPPVGVFRKHFLAHYTEEAHLVALADSLRLLSCSRGR
jgi:glycosyltransferase involved in cell wall biosynthesis